MEPFSAMLTGGHPNSLGRTVEVVTQILEDPARLEELYQCYFGEDQIVRLRTSSAFKRVWHEHPDWLMPYIDRILTEVATIDQASTRWTLAQLFDELDYLLTSTQKEAAKAVLKRNLDESNDWIVIIKTIEALEKWAHEDEALKAWLKPYLVRFQLDGRKSVAKSAIKASKALYSGLVP